MTPCVHLLLVLLVPEPSYPELLWTFLASSIGSALSFWVSIGCFSSFWTSIGLFSSIWAPFGLSSFWTSIGSFLSVWAPRGFYSFLVSIGSCCSIWASCCFPSFWETDDLPGLAVQIRISGNWLLRAPCAYQWQLITRSCNLFDALPRLAHLGSQLLRSGRSRLSHNISSSQETLGTFCRLRQKGWDVIYEKQNWDLGLAMWGHHIARSEHLQDATFT